MEHGAQVHAPISHIHLHREGHGGRHVLMLLAWRHLIVYAGQPSTLTSRQRRTTPNIDTL
jgi:hypothetical protein